MSTRSPILAPLFVRWAAVYFALWSIATGLYLVPKYGLDLANGYYKLWLPLVERFGALLGLDVVLQQTGSGDTAYSWSYHLLIALIAALGSGIWSAARRRPASPALLPWLRVAVRYTLGATMLVYGMAKVLPSQFSTPGVERLITAYGDSSPMGLLWTFMGQSTTYCVITGLVEVVGGALLFWRRTTLLGAAILTVALTQVVLLNFTFDVPVKLYSSHLLTFALLLMWPARHRLAAVFWSHDAIAAQAQGAAPGLENLGRRKTIAKGAVVGCLVATTLWITYDSFATWGLGSPRFELTGIYDVESFQTTAADATEPAVVTINKRASMTLWIKPGERQSARRFKLTLDGAELTALAPDAETPDPTALRATDPESVGAPRPPRRRAGRDRSRSPAAAAATFARLSLDQRVSVQPLMASERRRPVGGATRRGRPGDRGSRRLRSSR